MVRNVEKHRRLIWFPSASGFWWFLDQRCFDPYWSHHVTSQHFIAGSPHSKILKMDSTKHFDPSWSNAQRIHAVCSPILDWTRKCCCFNLKFRYLNQPKSKFSSWSHRSQMHPNAGSFDLDAGRPLLGLCSSLPTLPPACRERSRGVCAQLPDRWSTTEVWGDLARDDRWNRPGVTSVEDRDAEFCFVDVLLMYGRPQMYWEHHGMPKRV